MNSTAGNQRWSRRIRGLALAALSLAAACGGDDLVLPGEGIPTTIKVTAGDAQQGTVNTVLPDSIVVQVLDAGNRPVPGQVVNFAVVAGGGTASPASDVTDAQGLVAVEWALGPAAGTQQLRAQATGGAAPANLAVIASATAGASTAANLAKISGDAQTDVAGSTLNDSLIVKVTDGVGNPVAGVEVSWTITGGGTVSDARTTSGADGLTGVRRTLGTVAGPQTTVATAPGLNGSPVTFTATATVGSAGKLVITRQPSSSAQSGVPFAVQPQVQVKDANNNNVPGAGRAISAEIASGPAGATLVGGAIASTNLNGLATFSGLGISGPVGTYTLNFTGPDLQGVTSTPITLVAGPAARIEITTQPGSPTRSGVPLSPQPQVRIEDAFGNLAPVSVTVTAVLVSPPAGASLTGATAVTTSGVATFTGLAIAGPEGDYTLSFTSGVLAPATSSSISLVAVSASLSDVTASPATITAGDAGTTVTVAVRSGSGAAMAGVTVTPDDGAAGGTFTPSSAVTDGSGNATFTYTSTEAGVATISATAAGVAITATTSVTVEPAGPDAQTSSVELSPTSVAVNNSTTVTSVFQDQYGNPIPGVTVDFSSSGDGSFGSTSVVTDATGTASTTYTPVTAGAETITAQVGLFAETATLDVTN